ncbi:unnamed protein product, partial [Urochloa humidicola]
APRLHLPRGRRTAPTPARVLVGALLPRLRTPASPARRPPPCLPAPPPPYAGELPPRELSAIVPPPPFFFLPPRLPSNSEAHPTRGAAAPPTPRPPHCAGKLTLHRRTMGEPSKELLDLPSEPRPPASFIESLLASRDKQQQQQQDKEGKRKPGPPTDPLPKSHVLGKVKDFLGEIAKANQKLQIDTQDKAPEEYDIEALTGNEKEYIEMDLLLGVADLHSEQAVEAAEATMNGFQPSGIPFGCSSSDSEDDSDDSDGDGDDEPIESDKDKYKGPDEAETDPAEGKKPNKRQKIVVLN